MKIRIGERLLRAGVVTEEQIEQALARQRTHGGRLGDNLLAQGSIDAETLRRFVHKVPAPPSDLKTTGLPGVLLQDLALKIAFWRAEFSAAEIADSIKLPPSLVMDLLNQLRAEAFVEIKGSVSYLVSSLHYCLTDKGRKRADELLQQCSYAGPAPVPFEDYVDMVWHQTMQSVVADEPVIRAGFKDLVLPEELFHQLGPAINSGRSIFLYGPPGTGKTSVSKDIAALFADEVFIPHAFHAQGQIVQLFDEITHEPASQAPQVYDHRWVCSKRPVVVVGGELTLSSLELSANSQAGFFDSPVQLKANNGVLIIDDFGRQRLTVRDLLNRWIVPLETGQEHLGFPTGQKITVPFDELVIFCTNIEPRELVDEAFLRRIRHKIKLGHISPVAFFQILKLNCERNFIRYDQRTAEYLIESYYQKTRRPICAAHARDIVDHIIDYARYRRTEPVFSKEVVDVACSTYFVEGY